MNRIGPNKAVYIVYSIVDESGDVLEQSDLPIGYVHGAGSGLLPALERALEGRAQGDRVDVAVAAEEGFGPRDPNLTFVDDVANVPPEYQRIGAEVQFRNDQGEVRTFIVTRIEDGKVTIDGNHPLAGKDLTFHVTVREVRDATAEEIRAGRPGGGAEPLRH